MSDDDWFLPKRFGYGAGLPIAWQGWALLAGYLAVMLALGATLLPHNHPWLFTTLVLIATVPLLIVSAHHTRGGWRWRWGDDA